MFSRLVDMSHLETKQNLRAQHEKKSEKPFPLKKEEKKFSIPIDEDALHALRDMLAKQKKENDAAHTVSAAGPFTPSPLLSSLSMTTSEGISSISSSSQVGAVFAKLLQALFHIDKEGISETTLFLDSETFSQLRDCKIIITEYSTAPKVFNIQFVGSPQSLTYFEPHAAELLNALKSQELPFEVNRLDLTLLNEKEKYSIPIVEQDLEKERKN